MSAEPQNAGRDAGMKAWQETVESLRGGAGWRLVECRLDEESVSSRLEARAARKEGLSDATWATYLRQRGEFEQVEDASPETHLMLDTTAPLSTTGKAATDWLRLYDAAM